MLTPIQLLKPQSKQSKNRTIGLALANAALAYDALE
jgi:hypothetical protein